MTEPPPIGVMPTLEFKGLSNLNQDPDEKPARPLGTYPWEVVWEQEYATDAHFLCYYPVGLGQTRWARLNKSVLPQIRALGEGADVVTRVLAFDFDNPGHAAWSDDALALWLEALAEASEEQPLCWQWSVLYTTRHGARLVYLLDRAVPVDQAEQHHRWLTLELRRAGIHLDNIDAQGRMDGKPCKVLYPTSDWTRAFRLPKVVRAGQPTDQEESFMLETQPGCVLNVDSLGKVSKRSAQAGIVEERNEPKPDLSEALATLTTINDRGNRVQSEFYKVARRRLKGRECYPCLFEHAPLAAPGERNSTLFSFVGQACAMLYGVNIDGEPLVEPTSVYALFLDPVQQLEPDESNPDWTDALWRDVQWSWSREEAAARAAAEAQATREMDALDLLDQIAIGMSEWCKAPELRCEESCRPFVVKHLLASNGRQTYVMRPDGYYDPLGAGLNMVPTRVQALGMDSLIQVRKPTKDGIGWTYPNSQELLTEHATMFNLIQGVPSRKGGWIENLDSHTSKLILPIYALRSDIPAVYSRDVDEWLKAFFGENYDLGINWLAHALDIQGGAICALSIQGQQGAGKGMLAHMIAECFTNQTLATSDDLVGQYQPNLMTSPVIWIDEGWPRGGGHRHPSDIFREIVGGGRRYVNRKYKDPTEVTSPARVLLTANNASLVNGLCYGREMSPEDRDALAIRILHFDIGDRASYHLRRRGGEAHTQGWIGKHSGGGSRYTGAKHLFWLYENARGPRDRRLLVHGNGHQTLMSSFRTQSGSAPVVIECLIQMLESRVQIEGIAIEDSRLYVLTASVLRYWRKELASSTAERLTSTRISTVFKGLVTTTTRQRTLKSRADMGRKSWHEIDAALLQSVARTTGWKSTTLDRLVEEQISLGITERGV